MPDLNDFALIERGEHKLPELLTNIVIVGGRHQFFPTRELETIEYSIEETYKGLYQQLRTYFGKPRKGLVLHPDEDELTFARYGLWHYVIKSKQKQEPYATMQRAGTNLRGLIRVLLFKRFESSVYAFQETVRRLLKMHRAFLIALSEGLVPAGEEAQSILYESDYAEERELVDALSAVSGRYKVVDFDAVRLREHIEYDIRVFEKILSLVEPISPEQDAKLQTLKRRLKEAPFRDGKHLIFTQYADTARYLYENLNPGGKYKDIEVIYSGDKNKVRAVGRFAPISNPEYQFQSGETELNTLIATDVLAEGLNMQDCDKIINYDLHWNPVRLIQRFGRIDRIGSEHTKVYGFNFLPETGIEKQLGLRQKLHNRIQEIHNTIGEDSAILDGTEQLNEEAMYAIYEKNGGQLSLFEEDEEFLDLNEAKELLRQLRKEDPAEYERIAHLQDGIRSTKYSGQRGIYVFCQAGRYQQLFLVNENGDILSRDVPRILGSIKATPETIQGTQPENYNKAVMRVKRRFVEEVKHRQAEREHTLSLNQSQRYILRELRESFKLALDEDEKAQINLLEKAFRGPITTAINRELNLLRRNTVRGRDLLKSLGQIYFQHNMREWVENRNRLVADSEVPRIICSEGLI